MPCKRKTVHMAYLMNDKGGVSALCYASPRAISLARATWTNREEAVTCGKCKRALETLRQFEKEESP